MRDYWLSIGSCLRTRGYWLSIGSCPSRGATDYLLGAAPHEGLQTSYWELPLMRGHSNILVPNVTNILASLFKARLHSNTQGFSPKMLKLFKKLFFFWLHGNGYPTIFVTTRPLTFHEKLNGHKWYIWASSRFLVPLTTVAMVTKH